MKTTPTIAFFGAGSMAEAMISGIVHAGKIPGSHIIVTNRTNDKRLQAIQTEYGIMAVKREELEFGEIDIVILVVKPKDADAALRFLKSRLKPHVLIVSAVAGRTISWLEKNLPIHQPVIRIMPNTSSLICESATAISPGKHVSRSAIEMCRDLLNGIGAVYLIEENKMDIFTGIAGSGPAYFYYLLEYLEKAGKEEGLDSRLVREISAQTLLGAAKMILQKNEAPAQLREKVTSPHGTTAAGLLALEKFGGGTAIFQAVKQAVIRSKELSSDLELKVHES